MFVFQGALKLKPSGTRANARLSAHIAKQGLGQMLAFEIRLEEKTHTSFKLIKTLADELTFLVKRFMKPILAFV